MDDDGEINPEVVSNIFANGHNSLPTQVLQKKGLLIYIIIFFTSKTDEKPALHLQLQLSSHHLCANRQDNHKTASDKYV
jgi:hypothetical protein